MTPVHKNQTPKWSADKSKLPNQKKTSKVHPWISHQFFFPMGQPRLASFNRSASSSAEAARRSLPSKS